ncbi:MAG: mechanosensitive ion channel domain-containing protein [Cyanobacteria bacterium J06621_11]
MFDLLRMLQSGIESPFVQLGSSAISLSAIAQFLLIVLIALLLSLWVKRFLSRKVLSYVGLPHGTRESIAAIASYSLGALLCVVLLQVAGVNIASLAVVAGSLGIGVGFGLQEITRNVISGLTLLVEQKIKVGDFIEIDNLLGHITEISLRSTVIRTVAEKHVVLPNSDLLSNRVINWTYLNTKGWVSIPVSVSHESDPLLVIEVLMDSAYLEEMTSPERMPEVYFTHIGENSLDFKLWVWTIHIDQKFKIESSLNFIVRQNLKQHGIHLASPRLDVWNRNPNIVMTAQPQSYPQYAVLQKPSEGNLDAFSKPVPVRDLLRKLSYFGQCSDLELRKLVEIGRRMRLESQEILYEVGDPGDAFYIVLSGLVGYTLPDSKQIITISSGQFVGEFSLMLGVPRTVTIKAVEDTTLFALSPQGFQKLLRDQPQLYDVIVEEMGRHKAELSQHGQQIRGLINPDEYNRNSVDWIRKRLEGLFGA